MAEINLLKVPTANQSSMESVWGIVAKILAAFVVVVVAYYGYLYFKIKSINEQITTAQAGIAKAKSDALNMPGRHQFLVRQSQLKEFLSLSGAHVYYSRLLPLLANVTLKTAHYSNFNVSGQGKLTLSVTVPDLKELDKYLQVFNNPEVNKNFYNVRLGGFSKSTTANGEAYNFQIEMDYNMSPLVGA
jgi:hypothetical protein